MENFDKTKVPDETPAERLDRVMYVFFGKQVTLARKTKISPGTISKYVTGVQEIPVEALEKMQAEAKINAEYILHGTGKMMIDEAIKPVNSLHKSESQADKRAKKALNTGVLKHSILQSSGFRSESLVDSGEISVLEVVIDGISKPFITSITAERFCKKYNIKANSYFILSEDYIDGDIVLASYNREYMLLGKSGEHFIDIVGEAEVKITKDSPITILGSVYSQIIKW